jgi:hypothetical protein
MEMRITLDGFASPGASRYGGARIGAWSACVSDIFREVDEDLRRDSMLKLWQRYQNYIIGAAVLVVLATAGVTYWRYHDLQQRQAEGGRYAGALDLARGGKFAEAATELGSVESDAHAGRALIARFEAAALQTRAGKDAAAVAAYDAIAGDSSVDATYRDLATVLWGMHALDTADAKTVIDRLAPVTAAGNPWRNSAIEVTALAHLKAGDKAAARDDYQRLADDLTAPQSMRARAAEMITALTQS